MLRKMAARMMSKRRLSLALVAALIPTSAMATMVVNFGVAGGSIFKVNGAVGKNYTLPTDGVTVRMIFPTETGIQWLQLT